MGFIDELEDFEKQTISTIVFNMIKWFEFDDVTMNYYHRANVESSVWISIKIAKGDKTWYIDGQRNDIVKKRLIEWLTNNLNKNK